ncbi:MAG: hypothetical protein ACE5HH_00195, partial [Candidatus Hydrothermarchaeales archaeon]
SIFPAIGIIGYITDIIHYKFKILWSGEFLTLIAWAHIGYFLGTLIVVSFFGLKQTKTEEESIRALKIRRFFFYGSIGAVLGFFIPFTGDFGLFIFYPIDYTFQIIQNINDWSNAGNIFVNSLFSALLWFIIFGVIGYLVGYYREQRASDR